mgnify:CR=1 FL=1
MEERASSLPILRPDAAAVRLDDTTCHGQTQPHSRPAGLTAIEHAAWLRFGGGQALWEAEKKQLWLYSPGTPTNQAGPPAAALAQWVAGHPLEESA